jgi:nitroreductase
MLLNMAAWADTSSEMTPQTNLWRDLLALARWAPSPHNVQSWQLRPLADDRAELLVDERRTLPVEDPLGRFVVVGLGVFVETLAVAAHAQGYELDVDHDEGPLRPGGVFARLTLRPSSVEDLPPELIVARRTSRLRYDGRPVAPEVLLELEAIAAAYGHELGWSCDADFVDWVLALNRDTLFYDLEDAPTRAEIGSWMRYSPRVAAAARDGFAPECLGFPGAVLFVFFRLPWIARLPGLRGALRRLYGATTRGTRTVAWLKAPFSSVDDWFRAGRMLARLWLTLTEHGAQLHPFGSIITNGRAHARLRERLDVDERDGELWLIMRLGYSEQPPRSHRLEVEDLVVA